jgi:hypothetical protein
VTTTERSTEAIADDLRRRLESLGDPGSDLDTPDPGRLN